jgi:flagellar hook-basal body complex protein FliE
MQIFGEVLRFLFPFQLRDFFSFSSDCITAYFISASLVFFGVSFVSFLKKNRLFRDACDRIMEQTPRNAFPPESLQILQEFAVLWNEYRSTFVQHWEGQEKTETGADAFFSAAKILERSMNVRYWTMLPGLFVGWGILGTFVGLAYGVGGFDTGSTEAIRTSISSLLFGMNTAFATSIWGMLLSIFFNFLEKLGFRTLDEKAQHLVRHLDGNYRLSPEQSAQIRKKQQAELIRSSVADSLENLFLLREEGMETRPSHFLRDLLGEAEKQSKSLGNFSSNLANAIGEAVEHSLSATLGQLSTAIEMLREEKGKSTEELSELIVERLREGMAEMIASFHDAVSGSTQEQLGELSRMMVRSGEALEKIPHELHTVVGSFREQVDHMNRNMNQATDESLNTASRVSETLSRSLEHASGKLTAAAEKLEQSMEGSSGRLREETDKVMQSLGAQFQKGAESFGALTDGFAERLTSLLSEQEKSFMALSEVTVSLGTSMKDGRDLQEGFRCSTQDFLNALEAARSMMGEIVTATEGLNKAQTELVRTMGVFGEGNRTLLARHADVAAEMQKNLEGLRKLNDDYVGRFQTIEKGLRGIFSELGQGLGEYQKQVKSQLNDCLQQFADPLKNAVVGFSDAVDEMEEALDKWSKLVGDHGLVASKGRK